MTSFKFKSLLGALLMTLGAHTIFGGFMLKPNRRQIKSSSLFSCRLSGTS